MRPDLAKFRQSVNILKVIGNCLRFYLILGKIFGNYSMLLGTFSLLQIGKYGKIKIAIWSHWCQPE